MWTASKVMWNDGTTSQNATSPSLKNRVRPVSSGMNY